MLTGPRTVFQSWNANNDQKGRARIGVLYLVFACSCDYAMPSVFGQFESWLYAPVRNRDVRFEGLWEKWRKKGRFSYGAIFIIPKRGLAIKFGRISYLQEIKIYEILRKMAPVRIDRQKLKIRT